MIAESDPPFRMPSGYLIAESSIPKLAQRNGLLVCPVTNDLFGKDDLRKVFFS